MQEFQRRIGYVLCWAVLALSTTRAVAQDRPKIELHFRAPPECPSEAEVARRARTLIDQTGRDVTLRADAQIETKGANTFVLSLTIEHAGLRARRTLSSPDCAALGEAAAWLIALTVDPSLRADDLATAEEPRKKPEDLPKKSEAPASLPKTETASDLRPPNADAAPPEAPRHPFELHVRFGIAGGLLAQGLAGPTGTLGLYAGLNWGFAYSELRLNHAFARTKKLANDGDVDLASQTLVFSQCYETDTIVRLAPCLFALAQRTAGDVRGVDQGVENTSYWLLGGAGVGAFYGLVAPLEISGRLDLGLPLTSRPRFLIDTSEVAQARLLSVAVSLGVGARY